MKHRKRFAAVGLICAAVFVIVPRIRTETQMNGLLQSSSAREKASAPAAVKVDANGKSFTERHELFNRLWLNRHKRDVTSDLLGFLKDSNLYLKSQAVRALGRNEKSGAEKALIDLLKRVKNERDESREGVTRTTIQLALGRIRSSGQKGGVKLETVASNIGFSYKQVLSLIHRVNDKLHTPANAREAKGSSAYDIELEFLDLLYSMRRNGEDISSLGIAEYERIPAFKMRLDHANLSSAKEIENILNYACTPDSYGFNVSYLLGISPQASNAILAKLQEMLKNPEGCNLDSKTSLGFMSIFRAAGKTQDKRILLAMKQLQKSLEASPNRARFRRARYYLDQGISNFNDGSLPQFPPP